MQTRALMPGEPYAAEAAGTIRLSTQDLPARQRCEWLREVIGREYAQVEITPPGDGTLFNEMTIHPWARLRLSAIRSNAITLERLPREPQLVSHDAYFAVILLAGQYRLEQDGREVFLQPGDMALYDATRPHRVHCPTSFAKLIVSIPRSALRERVAGIEHCTALRLRGDRGIGCATATMVRSTAAQLASLSAHECSVLSDHCVDLVALAATSVRPARANLSRSRAASLQRTRDFVERNLADPAMDSARVASGVGLSQRYLNDVFRDEGTSLMRYVWARRLECCRRDLLEPAQGRRSVSEIAFRWGFNDLAHFSRAFKQRFGCSPRELRQRG